MSIAPVTKGGARADQGNDVLLNPIAQQERRRANIALTVLTARARRAVSDSSEVLPAAGEGLGFPPLPSKLLKMIDYTRFMKRLLYPSALRGHRQ